MSDSEQRPQDEDAPETVATSAEEGDDESPDVEGHRFVVNPAEPARAQERTR